MVTILTDYDIDLLMRSAQCEMPIGRIELYSYTDTKTLLTGEQILYDTVVSLINPEDSEPYLSINDDTTYCDYHPEDYDMDIWALYEVLSQHLLSEGYWGV